MADYSVGVYDFDPYFTFSRTVGGSITYSGPTNSTGTATITDNGSGIDGASLEDDSSGETATVDITVGGSTSTGVDVSAEESWTILNVTTGETFQMVTFHVESGPAAGYYTLSEKPLVVGHEYQTVTFDTNPNAGSDPVFTYSEYVSDQPDGTVEGTDGDDVIDASYSGDPQGEVVDGEDSLSDPAVDTVFSWQNQGADELDVFGGVSDTINNINVDVSFTDDGNSDTISLEHTSQHVNGDSSFDNTSGIEIRGVGGVGDTSTTTIDFSAVGGSGMKDEVTDVEFFINDLDTSSWQDIVTVRAFDADGNEITVNITLLGNETETGGTITGGPGNDTENQAAGSVLIQIPGPVSYITIDYDNGGTGGQKMLLTDIHFKAVPLGANEDVIDAGAGDDSINSGVESDTVYGGTGDDTINASADDDTLYGGDDADTFQLETGFGDDSIFGGEGGDDSDVIDATAITDDVTVTFSGDEAGTITDGSDTSTFSQIEGIELGSGDDTINGAADSAGISVDAGGGNDTITGGSGADVLTGGTGNDTINGGAGADTISGGDDADTVVLTDGFGADTITGGEGGTDTDTLDASSLTAGVSVTYTANETGTLNDGTDTASFAEMENLILTDQNDTVDASATTNGVSINGGGGADSLTGGSGNDTLVGGTGDDTLAGGGGGDTLYGGAGMDYVDYSTSSAGVTVDLSTNSASGGDATGDVFAGVDGIIGSAHADTLTGFDAQGADFTNIFYGAAGDDVLNGKGGDDTLYGGDDADTFIIEDGFGDDTIAGGEGGTDNDTLDASALTAGVAVSFSGDEAGTLESDSDSVTFSQIETFVLTDQDDKLDGTLTTSGISVDAGDGADQIVGGSGDDSLTGGAGTDSLFAGAGDDTVFGGTGGDTLNGGAGDDSLYGGADADTFVLQDGFGDDTIEGGETGTDADTIDTSDLTTGVTVVFSGNETGTITDGTDTASFSEVEDIILTSHDDSVNGAALTDDVTFSGDGGDDTLTSGSGADTLYGGTGADVLAGGDGNDLLSGGTGNDTLTLGDGDTGTGGDGDDTFTINQTDSGTGNITITGGEGGETDGDTLNFNGTLDKGTLVITDSDDANGGLTGYAYLLDGTRVDFTEIENIICFARGTHILTHTGERPIEELAAGDMVLTLDHGLQQIRWIGSRTVPAKGDFAPITIAKGVLGNHAPLTVSPQHRMLITGPTAELLFGEKEVLIPAKHLLSWQGITRAPMQEVEYFHILFDTHQLIHANGAPSESFHPGEQALDAVSQDARTEILTLFPELADAPTAYGPSARFSLKGFEAELLGQRMA